MKKRKPMGKEEKRWKKRRLFGTEPYRACEYCNRLLTFKQATIDHRQPVSRGGSHKLANLAIACKDCNQQKGSRSDREWRRRFVWRRGA